jgi:hypothetical protein
MPHFADMEDMYPTLEIRIENGFFSLAGFVHVTFNIFGTLSFLGIDECFSY